MLKHLGLELSVCLHHALSCFSKHPCVEYSAWAFIKRKKVHVCAERMLLQKWHLGFTCVVILGYSVSGNCKSMRRPWTRITLYIWRKYPCLPKKVKLSSALILGPFLSKPIWQENSLCVAKRSRPWQRFAKVKPCRCSVGALPMWKTLLLRCQREQHKSANTSPARVSV